MRVEKEILVNGDTFCWKTLGRRWSWRLRCDPTASSLRSAPRTRLLQVLHRCAAPVPLQFFPAWRQWARAGVENPRDVPRLRTTTASAYGTLVSWRNIPISLIDAVTSVSHSWSGGKSRCSADNPGKRSNNVGHGFLLGRSVDGSGGCTRGATLAIRAATVWPQRAGVSSAIGGKLLPIRAGIPPWYSPAVRRRTIPCQNHLTVRFRSDYGWCQP